MRTFLKIIVFLFVLLGSLLAGIKLGLHEGMKVSYEKLFVGEIAMGLRTNIFNATAQRRAGNAVYMNELDALILLDITELNKFTKPYESQYPTFQLAKTYYATFNLAEPQPIRPILINVSPMSSQEFNGMVDFPVVEFVKDKISSPSAK